MEQELTQQWQLLIGTFPLQLLERKGNMVIKSPSIVLEGPFKGNTQLHINIFRLNPSPPHSVAHSSQVKNGIQLEKGKAKVTR